MANMAQAIRMALHYAEDHLGVTDIFGEDVGAPLGGVFTELLIGARVTDHVNRINARGINTYNGHVTYEAVARDLGYSFQPILDALGGKGR